MLINIKEIIFPALLETLYMVLTSTFIAALIGLPWAILTYVTSEDGICSNKTLNTISNGIINILRSLPGIILIIVLTPLSRLIIGKAIGASATIVPLTFAAAPFIARLIEGAFLETDIGLIEAAKSMGADKFDIIKMLVRENIPSIIQALTMTAINLVGLSAMAGVLGGGGLGDIAIRYGYQRRQMDMLFVSVLFIIIIVQLIQLAGNIIYKKTNKN